MNIFNKVSLLSWYAGQKIKRIFADLSLSNPKAWDVSLWNLRGSQTESGETVDEQTCLTYSAVWNAITLISGTIGALPCHLMQNQGKTKKIADDIGLYGLMHDKWNPFMTAMAGRECMMAHILSWGNGFAEKVTNAYGEIVALWPIPPNRVIRLEIRNESELWYEIQLEKERKWFPREKILHIPGLGFDGFIGYSPIAMARRSIGLGMAMETFGSRFFSHGVNPSAVVTHPGQIKEPKKMREAMSEVYAGLGNTHRLMLLEEAMKFEQIGIKPEESQFLQSRQFQIPEIARWFNLPPHKLKDLTKSSFNNIEQEQISFVTDSILPWLIRLEQNYAMQLLNERQRRQEKLYFKHVVEGLLRADPESRAKFYKTMIQSTIMTPNEAREKEDLNPSDNPLADELFVMVNTVPLSKMDNYMASKNADRNLPEPQTEEGTEPVQPAGKLIEFKRETNADSK